MPRRRGAVRTSTGHVRHRDPSPRPPAAGPAPRRRLRRAGARRLRLDTGVVRFGFLLLTLAAGVGAVAYAIAWVAVPAARRCPSPAPADRPDRRPRRPRRHRGRRARAARRRRVVRRRPSVSWAAWPRSASRSSGAGLAGRTTWCAGAPGPLRIAVGVLLVATGFVVFVVPHRRPRDARPQPPRCRRRRGRCRRCCSGRGWPASPDDLGDERRARIRSEERAEIAAHLHDGVLQTLALIQRRAGDEREVAALARRQERELREWLYGRARPAGRSSARTWRRSWPRARRGRGRPPRAGRAGLRRRRRRSTRASVPWSPRRGRRPPTRRATPASTRWTCTSRSVTELIEAFVRDRGRGSTRTRCPTIAAAWPTAWSGACDGPAAAATVRSAPGDGTEVARCGCPRRRP